MRIVSTNAFLSEFVKHSKVYTKRFMRTLISEFAKQFSDLYRYDLVQTPKMKIDLDYYFYYYINNNLLLLNGVLIRFHVFSTEK